MHINISNYFTYKYRNTVKNYKNKIIDIETFVIMTQ